MPGLPPNLRASLLNTFPQLQIPTRNEDQEDRDRSILRELLTRPVSSPMGHYDIRQNFPVIESPQSDGAGPSWSQDQEAQNVTAPPAGDDYAQPIPVNRVNPQIPNTVLRRLPPKRGRKEQYMVSTGLFYPSIPVVDVDDTNDDEDEDLPPIGRGRGRQL